MTPQHLLKHLAMHAVKSISEGVRREIEKNNQSESEKKREEK
jgi:hypothetical protein